MLLAHEANVHVVLELPGLLPRHELLSVLVGVGELTDALVIEVALGTLLEVTGASVL